MRNIGRIPRMMEIIESYWIKVPDWRFGQLIENIKAFSEKPDLFYVEDDEMIELFDEFFILAETVELVK